MKALLLASIAIFQMSSYAQFKTLTSLDWYDSKGKIHKLKDNDFAKKITVIKFFKSNCPGCLSFGLPLVKQLSDHYKNDSKVNVLVAQTVFQGFRSNTLSKLKKIRKKYDLEGLMAHDDMNGKGSALINKYRAGGTPWFIILDGNGNKIFSDYRVSFESLVQLIEGAKKKAF